MSISDIASSIRRLVGGLAPICCASTPLDAERAERGFYIGYLREGMVVFDVGAHVGELTLLFSRFVGSQGHVHAFEATPSTFERLQTVCRLADLKNVTLNGVAVTNTEGVVELHLYDSEHSGWNTLANRPLRDYGIDVVPVETRRVTATTVDAYCSAQGIERVDLLKVDVEGAEYQVLQGARAMLAQKKILCCVFEFGATTFDMGNHPARLESYLKEYGYRIDNLVKGDRVFPGGTRAREAQFSMHVARPKR